MPYFPQTLSFELTFSYEITQKSDLTSGIRIYNFSNTSSVREIILSPLYEKKRKGMGELDMRGRREGSQGGRKERMKEGNKIGNRK